MHCRFVQIFDKDLKCLIYLGYWRKKHWKYLVFEKDAKADINLVELKLQRKHFVNPKIEIEVFRYIICSLDFKNISCTLFLLHGKTMNSVVSWYIPSRQILVPRMYPKDLIWRSWGRLDLMSYGRPEITSRGRPNLMIKGLLWEVDSVRPHDVLRTSPRGPSKHSNLDVPTFLLTFLAEIIRLIKSI